VKKLTIQVAFEIDDERRTFSYTLKHEGDSIYQDDLADLFRRLADDIDRRAPTEAASPVADEDA
jgi:hypothetical protein